MKKAFLFLVILLTAVRVFAQSEVTFRARYLPQHKYKSTSQNSYLMSMNIVGNAATQAKLKAQGIKMPMVLSMNSNVVVTTASGSLDTSQTIPLQMRYDKLENTIVFNGQKQVQENPLMGKSLYGEFKSGKLHIDSIGGLELADTSMNLVTTMINNLMGKISFPEKPMKVGDTFSQNVPFSIPLPGSQPITADIKILYKLDHIIDGKAYFNITEVIASTVPVSGRYVMHMTGGGAGTMIYDILNQFEADTRLTFEIKMHAQMDKTTAMNITMHGNSSQLAVITSN